MLRKQETMGWQWYQLDYMQIICTLLQTDNHASILPLNSLQAGRFSWYQWCQNIEGNLTQLHKTCLKTAKATSTRQCDVADVWRATWWFRLVYDEGWVTSVTSFCLFHLPEILQSLDDVHWPQHTTCNVSFWVTKQQSHLLHLAIRY